MKEKKRKGFLNILIIICMVLVLALTINVLPAASAMTADSLQTFTDMPDNWAKEALEKAVANGLLLGDNGKIMPDSPLTRAQMATIIVRVFGAGQEGDISVYSDIKSSDWFAGSMAKALKMGVMQGYDGKMNPESNISREQAFAVLARAMKLSPGEKLNKSFADAGSISDWAKGDVYALVNAGYIQGSGGKLNPQSNISRAEFAQIMNNIFIEYINTPGQYSQVAQGNIVVNVPGVSLENLTVNGDLIVGDGIGDGDLKLDQVTIKGNLILRGGGINSIVIVGGSVEGKIIVGKVDGQIRVSVEGGAIIETIFVDDGKDDVIIEGTVGSLNITGNNIRVIAKNAEFKNVIISGDNSKIVLEEGSKIKEAAISGVSATILLDQGTSVDKIIISGKGANIEGKGDVKSVAVKSGGDNASIRTPNTEIKVDKGVIGTLAAGGVAVEGGISAKNNAAGNDASLSKPGTSGNKTSSSGSTDIKVSAITVTGTGGATEITTDSGTLQMVAEVEPANASNKSVTWSVDDSSIATINSSGLLAAKTNGTVEVTATAKDGSGKKGIATIYISGQIVITNVTISPKTALVQKGTDETFTATVAGTGAFDSTVTWSVSGGASGTTIDTDGKLTVDASETAITLTVTATAKGDNSKSDSATVTVTDKEVFEVTFDPGEGAGFMAPVKVISGEKYTLPEPEFTAPEEYKRFRFWKVGTMHYSAGAEVEITESIKITALWSYKAVEIRNAPTKVLPGQSYNLTIYMDNILQTGEKVKEEVDFSIDGSTATSSGTTVSENGYLTVAIDETADEFTLRASKKGTTSIYDQVTISVHHGGALIIKASDPTTSEEREQALDDQGYYWNKGTKTLEIKDLNINEIGYGIVFSGFGYSDTINLQLHGTNKINIASGGITPVKGITYKTGNGGNLIIDGNGSLEIIMPDLGNTGTSYGIDLHSLTVKGKVKLKVICKKAFSAYGIKTQNDTIFEGNAKVEVESYGTVIGAFGNNGNIHIKENAEFKGIGSGIYPILNVAGGTDNGNIVFEKDTIVELIRINQPNSSGNPKFFDYNGVLTLASELELQGSESINGSSLVEAKLYGTDPNKTIVNDSDQDVFKYLLIEPLLTDEEKVERAKTKLDLGDISGVVADLTLPATQNGVAVTWSSSDTDVITNDGKVTRPEKGSEDATVTLTATLTLGSASDTKAFEVTVKAETINKIKTVTINGFVGAETGNTPITKDALKTTDASYVIVGLTWYEWDSVEDKEVEFTGTTFRDVSRYYYSAIIELSVKDDYHFVPKNSGQTKVDINTVPSDWYIYIGGMSTWEKLIIYIENNMVPR